MIKVYCHTNIDSCKMAKFPDKLLAVPRIGERVRAIGPTYIRGNDGSNRVIEQLELYVVGVVYGTYKGLVRKGYVDNGNGFPVWEEERLPDEPYVEIELHHPNAKELGLI